MKKDPTSNVSIVLTLPDKDMKYFCFITFIVVKLM